MMSNNRYNLHHMQGSFNQRKREGDRLSAALDALKVAREALQNIASSGRIVRTVHSDAARTALARIDALIGDRN